MPSHASAFLPIFFRWIKMEFSHEHVEKMIRIEPVSPPCKGHSMRAAQGRGDPLRKVSTAPMLEGMPPRFTPTPPCPLWHAALHARHITCHARHMPHMPWFSMPASTCRKRKMRKRQKGSKKSACRVNCPQAGRLLPVSQHPAPKQ